jgi:hypothetical protein
MAIVKFQLMNIASITLNWTKYNLNSSILKKAIFYPGTCEPSFRFEKLRRASMLGPPPYDMLVILF